MSLPNVKWVPPNPDALNECIVCFQQVPWGRKYKYTVELEDGPQLPVHTTCMSASTGAQIAKAYKDSVYRLFGLRLT